MSYLVTLISWEIFIVMPLVQAPSPSDVAAKKGVCQRFIIISNNVKLMTILKLKKFTSVKFCTLSVGMNSLR